MKLLKAKKKGVTLLEILISIAILAIVSIPVAGMLTTAVRTNKNGEDKQKATLMGQQILEEIRVTDDFSRAVTLSGFLTINLSPGTPSTVCTGTNDGFLVSVNLKKDNSIQFTEDTEEKKMDGNLYIKYEDLSGNINVSNNEGFLSSGNTGDTINDSFQASVDNKIIIENRNDKIIVSLKASNVISEKLSFLKKDEADKSGNIKINLMDYECYNKLKVEVINNVTDNVASPVSLYLDKTNSKAYVDPPGTEPKKTDTRVVSIENSVGTLKRYNNVISEDESNDKKMGSVYNVEVKVSKDSKDLFIGEAIKNIYIK